MSTVPPSSSVCPDLAIRNVDYQQQRLLLERMDDLLRTSGLEEAFCLRSLAFHQTQRRTKPMTAAEQTRFLARSRMALRCQILRYQEKESLRVFSRNLVGNTLRQQFCHVPPGQPPSKSQLARFAQWLPEPEVHAQTHALTVTASQPDAAGTPPLDLQQPVNLATGWGDSTALPTPMHHPVDWLLIRDAIRALILAILCLRRHGVRSRMRKPVDFLTAINRLCIRLSQAKRGAATGTAKRQAKQRTQQKRVIRAMLRVLTLVETHACRHLLRLRLDWELTTLSPREAARIADRITRVLDQLPQVRAQVETRLVLEQTMPNAGKLLSLFQSTSAVLVRGKTGHQVEYGQMLWVVEQNNGLILDWYLAPGYADDPTLTAASISRLRAVYAGQVHTLVADRGCDGPEPRAALETVKMHNALAPRSPREYAECRKRPFFRVLQRRRSQTEARISILKQGTLVVAQRARSDPARERAVTWGVLTHNLWVLARLPQRDAFADAA